ncbi:ribonuclease H-like domain-containing protein [Tanacetum coccineum]
MLMELKITEDANHKFLRSLPVAWSNLAMTMRTKPEVDTLSIDDLYNNQRVLSMKSKDSTKHLKCSNVAFVFHKQKQHYKANEIYEKDEKLKRYRRIGMKAIKEKEQLQKTLDSWKDSSKNLWRLINSGIVSNNLQRLYDIKVVPHPLSGDYTPKPQEEIDDSLYVYGKKGPQKPEISDSDDNSTKHSTCQSNDNEGSCGNTSEHSSESESKSISVPNEMSMTRSVLTNEKVMSELQEVEPSCAKHVKTPRQQMKDQATPKVNRKNWNAMMEREQGEGYSFTKKKCFVCGSLSHLIKDCDYYEKKMAREAEVKKQRVVNTGNGVAKPVWKNANRVNHSNKFVPRSIQLNAGLAFNVVSSNVNTVRSRQPVPTKTSNSFSPKRPQMNQFNQRRDFSKSHSSVRRPFATTTSQMSHSNAVKGNWGTAVKTSACHNWRNSRPNSDCDSGPTFIRTEHPLKNMVDRGIFDSRCSGHMTGNKDQLEDFEEFNGGSVTFGGSKGYISGKGKIRVGNLDFDSVSFVKELGHFNLFSISQICDKQHKVLFTKTECLVVSSDFKMPDENQILLKVSRHHNMYSFDMKTPTPAKGFTCLIAKATSDESKLWHIRLGHINFKNLNKLVKGNLVRGLPSKNTEEKVKSRTSSTNSKKEEILTEPQQEKKVSSIDTSEDNPKILAFRRELEEIALKHLGKVSENTTTSTPSVNTGSEPVNTGSFDPDDPPMPKLKIFHKSMIGSLMYLTASRPNIMFAVLQQTRYSGEELQIESSKKLKSDTREDVSVPKEKHKESVKKEEGFEIKKPFYKIYSKENSLGRKGMQRKLNLQSLALRRWTSTVQMIVRWQIIKTGKRGAYQIIREDNTNVVYMNDHGTYKDKVQVTAVVEINAANTTLILPVYLVLPRMD